MRAIKIIIFSGILLFLAAVLSAGYTFFLRPMTLPVYHFAQPMAKPGKFPATTLTLGNTVYISDAAEFPLEMTAPWIGKNRMIGRTDDGMDVYAIPQQDPQDYIMLTTLMFPNLIFRNTSLPPVQLSNFQAGEIQLFENKTRDQSIITEVTDCLIQRENIAKSGETYQSAMIRLMSDKMPGLAYTVYAITNSSGSVFLADRLAPDDWIPAGPAFTGWFRQFQLKPARQ